LSASNMSRMVETTMSFLVSEIESVEGSERP
jgi:hypothetical protein